MLYFAPVLCAVWTCCAVEFFLFVSVVMYSVPTACNVVHTEQFMWMSICLPSRLTCAVVTLVKVHLLQRMEIFMVIGEKWFLIWTLKCLILTVQLIVRCVEPDYCTVCNVLSLLIVSVELSSSRGQRCKLTHAHLSLLKLYFICDCQLCFINR